MALRRKGRMLSIMRMMVRKQKRMVMQAYRSGGVS